MQPPGRIEGTGVAYAGSFLLYAELRKQRLQECQRPCENRLLVMVAVEEKVVDLCVNGRTGVFQIIRKKIVSRNVQCVGDRNEEFETWISPAAFNVAYMLGIYRYSAS